MRSWGEGILFGVSSGAYNKSEIYNSLIHPTINRKKGDILCIIKLGQ